MIYQTDNMEAAIRAMVYRNSDCLLLRRHFIKKAIRLRSIDIKDLGGVLCKAKSPLADGQIARWKQLHGLLYYHWSSGYEIPDTDALFFVECPLQYFEFQNHLCHVNREVVIYRPPVWTLHEQKIEQLYPSSTYLLTIMGVVEALRNRPLDDLQSTVLEYSGLPGDAAVFYAHEIEAITGIESRNMTRLIKNIRFNGIYLRYTPIAPIIEPEDPTDKAVFDSIVNMGAGYQDYRLLRPIDFVGVSHIINRLIRTGYLATRHTVYLVGKMDRALRYAKIDAVNATYRANWYRMKNVVDNAPKYPIPPQMIADLAQIRSARYERSLFLARRFGTSHSTPTE